MKKKRVGKVIGFIGLCIFVAGISYVLTKYLDKNMYLNTELVVTLEDSKEFSLENTNKLTKEEALKTYPNTFKIENKSLKKVSYKVLLNSKEKDNLDKINYILYLNDKEIVTGKISSLKDNLLYKNTINRKKTDIYKLYLYLDDTKDIDYKYSIKVEVD